MTASVNDCDVLIIGLGAMGTAAAFHLAKRGARVIGFDRSTIPNRLGSSHGGSRVIRLCYYEHPDYVPLLRRAYELWEALERRTREPLLHITGGLYLGSPDGEFISGTLRAAREHDLPHEFLCHEDVRRRYPQFRVPGDHVGVYEPRAGFLVPERVIEVHTRLAREAGAELHDHEAVQSWDQYDDGICVRTSRVTYRAAHMICCAGAWTAQQLPELAVHLSVTRQTMMWLQPRREELFSRDRFPIWGIDDPDGFFHYGFPLDAGRAGLKVARHHRGPLAEPDAIDRTFHAEDEQDIRRAVLRFLPEADGAMLGGEVCMYTNSPDGHFIIDRHPACEHVTIAAGFSGHGFKFASVIGEIMADLALHGGTDLPIRFLSLDRFHSS